MNNLNRTYAGNLSSDWDDLNLKEVEALADQNDPNAIAILNLYKQTRAGVERLREEMDSEVRSTKKKLDDYEGSLKKTDLFVVGVLVFVVITFSVTMYSLFFNLIKDKDLYSQNNNLYQNYSERNIHLNNIIGGQSIEILDLKNDIQRIYDKNSYLK